MDRTGLRLGALAGLVGIACCVSPVVLVLLGLASVSFAISLGNTLYDAVLAHGVPRPAGVASPTAGSLGTSGGAGASPESRAHSPRGAGWRSR